MITDFLTKEKYSFSNTYSEIVFGFANSPFGKCMLAISGESICYLGFVDNSEEQIIKELRSAWPLTTLVHDDNKAVPIIAQIFQGKEFPLAAVGTTFQISVWKALLEIPTGDTVSYSDIALKVGKPLAVRAAASAIANNRIAYIIPCHRVIGKSGALTGYRHGIERKKLILNSEKIL